MTDVYSHPDYQQFLARIRERPDDDLPRLVCADWLEERGEDERAELIRQQVAGLIRLPKLMALVPYESILGVQPHQTTRGADTGACYVSAVQPGGELLMLTFSRGFVSRVSGPLASLHGRECVAACPETGNICHGGRTTAPNPAFTRECRSCPGTGRTPGVLAELLRREPIGCGGIEVTDFQPIQINGGSWSLAQWRLTPGQRDLAASLPYETFATADAARLALSRVLYSIHAPKSEVLA